MKLDIQIHDNKAALMIVDEKAEVQSGVLYDRTKDFENVLKHPFLLRIRLKLALGRMQRRQKKIAKFLAINSVA